MKIRRANASDEDSIRQIHLEAFDASESALIADLSSQLLNDASSPETINLVADENGDLLGHVAFSPVFRKDDQAVAGYILAPLAVVPKNQKAGLGRQLVEAGIEKCKHLGISSILVYGDPAYYSKFGFNPEVGEQFTPPYELKYPFGWLGIQLSGEATPAAPIALTCVDALNKPELW